jgi:hypothetical protein
LRVADRSAAPGASGQPPRDRGFAASDCTSALRWSRLLRPGVTAMRTDASVTNGNPALGCPSREGPTATQLVELLEAAYPINWKQLLCRRLAAIGVTHPADLTPAQLAKFGDEIFRAAKQAGIQDPAGWIADRAQLPAQADVPRLRCTEEGYAPAIQPKSAGPPAAAMSWSASAPLRASRTALYG